MGLWACTLRPCPLPTGRGLSDPDAIGRPRDRPQTHDCPGVSKQCEHPLSHVRMTSRMYGVPPNTFRKSLGETYLPCISA